MHAQRFCFQENAPRLFRSEGAGLNEGVAELCELSRGDGVEIINDALDESRAIVEKLGRHGVRAKICRNDFKGLLRPHRFENANLGCEIQSVAALRFDGCCTVLEETIWKLHVKLRRIPY